MFFEIQWSDVSHSSDEEENSNEEDEDGDEESKDAVEEKEVDDKKQITSQKNAEKITKLSKKSKTIKKTKIERKREKLKKKASLQEKQRAERKDELTRENKEKASEISTLRVFSNEDFKKIDVANVKKQVTHAKRSTKRPVEDESAKGELVKLGDIENIYKKRKHDKQARVESVKVITQLYTCKFVI